jgi:hypothetical protein
MLPMPCVFLLSLLRKKKRKNRKAAKDLRSTKALLPLYSCVKRICIKASSLYSLVFIVKGGEKSSSAPASPEFPKKDVDIKT